ncbi:hypothetical protein DS884_07435 [Tenacibaculum sp. E3R01]|uniref:DUF4221 family protein n=1 Tax=Tenacibaculum sp. E3R01 TaxID=2267227 RepID=UPI000DE9FCF6|nr:DUF4221 family protein [Tenacibaculum sp. E3R01]RBW59559.1 hypothetical protein DS884_07435 [Tenacibaculum sp. E3R01]
MRYISIIILLILFSSCKRDKKIINNSNNKVIITKKTPSDSLNLKIDEKVQLSLIYYHFIEENNRSFLINKGSNPVKLNKIDVFTGEVLKTQYFEREGPNGYGGSSGLFYQNKDSIYILNGYADKLLLFDSISTKTKEYPIDNKFSIESGIHQNAFVYKDQIFIHGTEYLKQYTSEYSNKANILTKINLKNGNQKRIINYPKEFKNQGWKKEYQKAYSLVNDSSIFISFGKSHYVYKYDLNGNLIKKFSAKSKFIKNASPIKNKDNNSNKAFDELYRNGYYTKLFYNKETQQYYRFCYYLKKDFDKDYDLVDLTMSVLVFDKSFNLISENQLPYEVSGWYSFVKKDGIYISLKPFHKEDCSGNDECLKFYFFKF